MRQIIIHHSAAYNHRLPQFSAINDYHQSRGFPLSSLGFHGGYQYLVDGDERVKQYRNEDERGAHTVALGKDYNRTGIGICVAGDFTRQQPTNKQLELLGQLVIEIQHRWDIADDQILLHRDVKNTRCPGTDLKSHIMAIRASKDPRWKYDPQAWLSWILHAFPRQNAARKKKMLRIIPRLKK